MSSEQIFLHVEGISCTKCIAKIRSYSKNEFQLQDLRFNLSEKTLKFSSNSNFVYDKYQKGLSQLGFQIRPIKSEDQDSLKGFQVENKDRLIRLGVAGACTGNNMLISTALYLGADQSPYAQALAWISFVFYLPVLFYSAAPIITESLDALKKLRPSVDLPIALALVVGGALSLLHLIQQNHNIYFDSLSALVFFLLCTRYLVFQIRRHHLSPFGLEKVSLNSSYQLESGPQVQVSQIELGQKLLIKKGQTLPADALLLSDSAQVDSSFLTGESLPVSHQKFEQLYSGSRLVSQEALIEIKKLPKESRLHSITEKLNDSINRKTKIVNLTDQGAQRLTYLILASSSLFLIFYTSISFSERLERVLALLVIACPCALAISTPLALSLAVKRLFKRDLLVKNPDAFEILSKIKNVVFDKTGTLTTRNLKVSGWLQRNPTDQEEQIIYNLEKDSEHPIAKALLRSLKAKNQIPLDLTAQETAGKGVEGTYQGNLYSIESSSSLNSNLVFKKNGEALFEGQIQSEVLQEAPALLSFLKQEGLNSHLLTGDKKSAALELGQSLSFNASNIYFEQSPESKLEKIKSLDHVFYLGDGLNDGAAMAASDLSLSVKHSVEETFKASDLHLNKENLLRVIDFFKTSKKVLRVIYTNLGISFIYNLSFGFLALGGFITPLLTAIIMPISSLIVVGITFFSLREKN